MVDEPIAPAAGQVRDQRKARQDEANERQGHARTTKVGVLPAESSASYDDCAATMAEMEARASELAVARERLAEL